ncbi:MAG: hypothetical protein RLZZ552_415 [Verrucomicrobiota bacterium]|jgi:cobalt-zinc-cadmium efflux system outer membrane protein
MFFIVATKGAAASVPGDLTLREALARVEARHPSLAAAGSAERLAKARTAQAQASPGTEVSLQLENALGTGEHRAARSLETTLQIGRILETPDRRSVREATAGALNDVERLAREQRHRELLGKASVLFIQVAAAQESLAVAREAAEQSDASHRAVLGLAEAGVALPADVSRSRLLLAESRLEAEHAEHQLLVARQALSSMWSADVPDFGRARADLSELPPVETFAQLSAKLSSTPVQLRFAAEERWRAAQERLERRNASRGDLRWTAGVRRFEAADDVAAVFGLSYAIPSPGLSSARSAEAQAERELAAASGAAALNTARSTLYALHQNLAHARIAHLTAVDQLIPAAQAWCDAVSAGMRTGRYHARDLGEARAALLEGRRRAISASAEYHATLVEIEQMLAAAASP